MAVPSRTRYHRWMGWHAPALRRLVVTAAAGVVVGLGLALVATWQVAVLGGWDAAAVTFMVAVVPIVLHADGEQTRHLAVSEDVNRDVARVLLLAACGTSLVAVGFALSLARREAGAERVLLIAVAALTVVISWTVVNLVFTLRYAHLYYGRRGQAVDFGSAAGWAEYRDFAYLAFTIGMTYQVSDTTLRDRGLRRAVLVHALLSYVFGVVIVSAGVNIVAGLLG